MCITRYWNYIVKKKTPENIQFEINKIIDFNGMDSVGIEGKLWKIFGSNSKLSNSKLRCLTIQTLSVKKYSVQNQ
jgi:hypothetical protein